MQQTWQTQSRLVERYNNLEHMSLKDDLEMPAKDYIRKKPPKDKTTEEIEADVRAKLQCELLTSYHKK